MAKKKQRANKTTGKSGSKSELPPGGFPPAFDRRIMEGFMQHLVPGLTGEAPADSPLERAQEVMYQAFDIGSDPERVALAKKALKISPDCADAYVLLAENAETFEETMKCYADGVAAGERALGKKGFKQRAVCGQSAFRH